VARLMKKYGRNNHNHAKKQTAEAKRLL